MIFSSGKSIADAKSEQEAKTLAGEKESILSSLDALDRKSARALRAVVAGTATDKDKARLGEIEAEATDLRAKLAMYS